MRGEDQQQNHMFSYLSPEARVRKDHPLRAIRVMVDEVLSQLSRRFDGMYATVGPSVDCAGEVVAGADAADAVLDPQRAVADGRDGLQPAVPLVRGAEREDALWLGEHQCDVVAEIGGDYSGLT